MNRISPENIRKIGRDTKSNFWNDAIFSVPKISATKLKQLQRSDAAQNLALTVWEKMTKDQFAKIQSIDCTIMKDGEIKTKDINDFLKDIVEQAGIDVKKVKAIHPVPSEAILLLTSQILEIFNHSNNECSEEEVPEPKRPKSVPCRLDQLLEKARKLGLGEVDLPPSMYANERARLAIIERQIKGKMKLKSLHERLEKNRLSPVKFEKPNHKKKMEIKKRIRKVLAIREKMRAENAVAGPRPASIQSDTPIVGDLLNDSLPKQKYYFGTEPPKPPGPSITPEVYAKPINVVPCEVDTAEINEDKSQSNCKPEQAIRENKISSGPPDVISFGNCSKADKENVGTAGNLTEDQLLDSDSKTCNEDIEIVETELSKKMNNCLNYNSDESFKNEDEMYNHECEAERIAEFSFNANTFKTHIFSTSFGTILNNIVQPFDVDENIVNDHFDSHDSQLEETEERSKTLNFENETQPSENYHILLGGRKKSNKSESEDESENDTYNHSEVTETGKEFVDLSLGVKENGEAEDDTRKKQIKPSRKFKFKKVSNSFVCFSEKEKHLQQCSENTIIEEGGEREEEDDDEKEEEESASEPFIRNIHLNKMEPNGSEIFSKICTNQEVDKNLQESDLTKEIIDSKGSEKIIDTNSVVDGSLQLNRKEESCDNEKESIKENIHSSEKFNEGPQRLDKNTETNCSSDFNLRSNSIMDFDSYDHADDQNQRKNFKEELEEKLKQTFKQQFEKEDPRFCETVRKRKVRTPFDVNVTTSTIRREIRGLCQPCKNDTANNLQDQSDEFEAFVSAQDFGSITEPKMEGEYGVGGSGSAGVVESDLTKSPSGVKDEEKIDSDQSFVSGISFGPEDTKPQISEPSSILFMESEESDRSEGTLERKSSMNCIRRRSKENTLQPEKKKTGRTEMAVAVLVSVVLGVGGLGYFSSTGQQFISNFIVPASGSAVQVVERAVNLFKAMRLPRL